jgi:uncharacterized membrane protein
MGAFTLPSPSAPAAAALLASQAASTAEPMPLWVALTILGLFAALILAWVWCLAMVARILLRRRATARRPAAASRHRQPGGGR